MSLLIVLAALILLVLFIAIFHINAFLAFMIVSVAAGLALGIPADSIMKSVEKGMGDTLGSIAGIIVLGAMMGKLIADSGAAQQIASSIVERTGLKYIRWSLALAGFIIGIPLFYGVGFVLMIPLIFSVVYQYKLPAVSIGLPMLAALSVSFGFLPPHPSPSALVVQFHASMGTTLLLGIIIAVPTIIIAGPVFSKTLKNIISIPLQTFQPVPVPAEKMPSVASSFLVALLPIVLFVISALLPFIHGMKQQPVISFLSQPSIVLLISLAIATWMLGLKKGRSMKSIMITYAESVKEVAMILLIIGGAGSLKQVLLDSGVSVQITKILEHINLPPLLLAWLIAALIRVAVGSATVAALTAAGIIAPLMVATNTNPSLMVLSIGSGSLMFSHVNDSGFWLFKEYFNISIKDTLRSWSLMETIVSLCGLAGVLLLNLVV
jgi:Gnt-I system high-affinity gluconate transporter